MDQMQITIRRLTYADRDVLQNLRPSSLPQPDSSVAPWSAIDDFWGTLSDEKGEALLRASEANNGQILLGAFPSDASDASQLLGIVGLRPEPRPTIRHKASLFGLYVVPGKRRQGIGTRLVAALLQEARNLPPLEMLRLVVVTENTPTVVLLHKHGFQTYAVEPRARLLEGTYYEQAFLYRFLEREGEGGSL